VTALWVAAGGALGAVARYGIGGWVQRSAGLAFPWGTLTVNAVGCLLIGFLMVWLRVTSGTADARAFLITGVLGGFTTFSAFGWETVALAQEGAWGRALLYALGSVLLGVATVVLGITVAERLLD
jgi:CrcB protein